MRLIDADTLKNNRPELRNTKQEGHQSYNQGWNNAISDFLDLIDNAPTVEERPQVVLFTENMTEEEKQKLKAEFKEVMDNAVLTVKPEYTDEDIKRTIKENFDLGYEMAKNKYERPKGEWLEPYESKIAQECSICHRQMPAPKWFNFCPNCGADMRGDKITVYEDGTVTVE